MAVIRTDFGVRNLLLGLFFLAAVPHCILSHTFPIYAIKRQYRSMQLPVYVPVSRLAEYRFPEYEDPYGTQREEDDYAGYPVYGYYADAPERREIESYGYVEDSPASDPILDLQEEMLEEDRRKEESYPYGQETWFERDDAGYETDAAFLPMLTQMYGRYPDPEDRGWTYGVPVMEVDDGERAVREDDESVRELESLRAPLKASKQKNKLPKTKEEIYRELREKNNINSRKMVVPSVSKKQSNSFHAPEQESATTTEPTTLKPNPTTRPRAGQKEYVLPRPANPIRKPFEVSTRSSGKQSIYDTIRKLLNMEERLRQKKGSRIRKRFVLNEDQLTSELSGLKKMAV